MRGRSHCPACGRVLSAVDLVPVFGYAVRRGRCAGCGWRIPARYPLLEAACALLVMLPVLAVGPVAGIAAGLALVGALAAGGLAAAHFRG